jgi:DNA polymerase III subunit delta
VERALGVLRGRLLPGGRGTWRTLWGDQDAQHLRPALEDLASPSLFGGTQVLVVRHADALREDDQAVVLEALPSLGEGGSLILVAGAADQRRRLFGSCLRAGAAHAFPQLDTRAAQPWVVRLARERGHEIAPAATQDLVERGGSNLGVLDAELEKLSLHAGPRTRIEQAHVRAMVTAARAHGVDELTDRLARRDRAGAARMLRQLLAEGEPPLRLIAFLASNLRRSLHVSELAETGLGPEQIGQRLNMPAWLVSKSLGRGKAKDLTRALFVLRRVDLELKSARAGEAVLDAALLEITSS